jgi:LysM repeat protein
VAALAVSALLAANVIGARAGAEGPVVPRADRIYVVRSGDTLWRIARTQAGPKEDVRPLVDRLIRANHLRSAAIVPGQELVLSS